MTAGKAKVLIVEDQFLAVEFLRIWVEAYGYEVCGTADSADRAADLAFALRPDIVLMDVRLEGDKDGVDAAFAIYTQFQPRIIYCTGSAEPSTLKRINEDHPFEILFKPIDPAELGRAMARSQAS